MTYISKKRQEHISKFLEDSKIFNFRDIDFKKRKVKRHLYKDLGNVDLKGYYPFASEYVDENFNTTTSDKGELCFYFLPVVHELYIGTTGSGKTTGCVEPQLRAVSSLKHKPNLFVTDPKGELFERNAKHLKKQGYEIYSLNFKDIDLSDRWNPLLEMYDEYQKRIEILEPPKRFEGKVDKKYEIYNKSDVFEDFYYVKDNQAFPSLEYAEYYKYNRLSENDAKVQDLVNQFSDMVVNVRSTVDPSWEEGALRLFKGLLYAMLEDSINPNCNFTRDMMNLQTARDLYLQMSNNSTLEDDFYKIIENSPFMHKSDDDISIQLMRQSMENAGRTRRSYLGVFDTSTQKWFDNKILHLTLDNTIDIDLTGDTPFAIFLITRDYEKNDFAVAGLFIDWLYRKMIQENELGNVTRELHFILDEFGNIPRIRDFENKIATARSRGVYFHLVVQSYAQLQIVYDEHGGNLRSNVIVDNCNAQIFLGSQHFATRERFSQECGYHNILSFDSYINPETTSFVNTLLVPLSKLDNIIPGEIYIKRTFMPVLKSRFVRSYLAKEFFDDNYGGFDIIDLKRRIINLEKFTYIPPKVASDTSDWRF